MHDTFHEPLEQMLRQQLRRRVASQARLERCNNVRRIAAEDHQAVQALVHHLGAAFERLYGKAETQRLYEEEGQPPEAAPKGISLACAHGAHDHCTASAEVCKCSCHHEPPY